MAEAISLAKDLNDMHALAIALLNAGFLGHLERNPTKVERLASDLIELSTRHQFASWMAGGEVLRGWAHSVSGDAAEGLSLINRGINDWRASGLILLVPYWLALKAEALYLADRILEALEAIREAEEEVVERSQERWWCAELHRLHGVCFSRLLVPTRVKLRLRFAEAIKTAIVFQPVIIVANDDNRFVRPSLVQGCCDRQEVIGIKRSYRRHFRIFRDRHGHRVRFRDYHNRRHSDLL